MTNHENGTECLYLEIFYHGTGIPSTKKRRKASWQQKEKTQKEET